MYFLLLSFPRQLPSYAPVFLLPLITFLLFLITTFVDVNNSSWKIIAIILLSAFFISFFEGYSNFKSDEDNLWLRNNVSKVLEQLDISLNKVDESIKEIKVSKGIISEGFRNQEQSLKIVINHLDKKGANDLSKRLQQSQEAEEKILNLEQKPEDSEDLPRRKTQNIKIVYYPKKSDEDDLDLEFFKKNMEEQGFNFNLGTPRLSIPTNAIWFGKNLPIEDVKLVAYYLINSGVSLKAIRPFRNPQSKVSTIEIGADANSDIVNRPTLTLSEIELSERFSR